MSSRKQNRNEDIRVSGTGEKRLNEPKGDDAVGKEEVSFTHQKISAYLAKRLFDSDSKGIELINTLNHVWESDNQGFPETLKTLLLQSEVQSKNIMWLALYILMNCPDFTCRSKNSQTFAVMIGLKTYVEGENGVAAMSGFLDEELQRLAFKVAVIQKRKIVLEEIIKLYKLVSANVLLMSEIENMSYANNFRQACVCADYLSLYYHFNIHLFIIPLYMQDNFSVALKYLESSPRIVRLLISYFNDMFAEKNVTVKDTLMEYVDLHQIPDVKLHLLDKKPVAELLISLASIFKIHCSTFPNIQNWQRNREIRHIFKQKYICQEICIERFWELINEIANRDEQSHEDILSCFFDNDDYESTADFINKYPSITSDKWLDDMITSCSQANHVML